MPNDRKVSKARKRCETERAKRSNFQTTTTRRFVEARLKNLQSMLTGEPRLVRAEIAKHVEKITMTPEGRTYVAAGKWDLLGGVAVRMVPGARTVHNSPRIEFQIEVAA
jgi:hypothetical protein